jgi:hypothetical protein
VEANAVHALHAGHGIMIAAPNRLGAVSMRFNFEFDGQESGRAMMLRPIEFDAAGNPWTGKADERGLDDGLAVNRVVAVCFVLQDMDTAANFREHKRADEFVFDPYGFPFAVNGFFSNAIRERQRVYFAAAALVNAFLEKHRAFVRRGWEISGNNQVLDTHLDRLDPFGMSIKSA